MSRNNCRKLERTIPYKAMNSIQSRNKMSVLNYNLYSSKTHLKMKWIDLKKKLEIFKRTYQKNKYLQLALLKKDRKGFLNFRNRTTVWMLNYLNKKLKSRLWAHSFNHWILNLGHKKMNFCLWSLALNSSKNQQNAKNVNNYYILYSD